MFENCNVTECYGTWIRKKVSFFLNKWLYQLFLFLWPHCLSHVQITLPVHAFCMEKRGQSCMLAHLLLLVHTHIYMLTFCHSIHKGVKGGKEKNINRKTTSWQLPPVSPVFPPDFWILQWLLICPTWVFSQWGCFPFPFCFHLIQSKQLTKNKPIQAAVNGPSAFRCLRQEEEGILFWR